MSETTDETALAYAGEVPDLTQGETPPGHYRTDGARGLVQVGAPAAAVDTREEAVVWMVRGLLEDPGLFYRDAAATLHALLAERDAARKDAATHKDAYLTMVSRLSAARTEAADARDAGCDEGKAQAAALAARMAAEAREDARYRVLAVSRARDLGAAAALEALRDRLGGCDG